MFDDLKKSLEAQGSVSFSVKARPSASKTRAKDVLTDGTLKIDVAAQPEDGKANAALVDFLAGEFEVPKANVEIVLGHTSPRKKVSIRK